MKTLFIYKSANRFSGYDYTVDNTLTRKTAEVIKVHEYDCYVGKWVAKGYRIDMKGHTVYWGDYRECMAKARQLVE